LIHSQPHRAPWWRVVVVGVVALLTMVACSPTETAPTLTTLPTDVPPTDSPTEAPTDIATDNATADDSDDVATTPVQVASATTAPTEIPSTPTAVVQAPIVNNEHSEALDFRDGRPFFLYSYASW
jgi:hypothetical protein